MSETKRRLAIMGLYPPLGAAPVGGVESVNLSLVAELARRPGLEVHMVQHRQSAPAGVFQGDGFKLHNLPAASQRIIPNTLRTQKLARAWLRRMQPHSVISHHPSFAMAACDLHIPVVHVIHGMPTREFWTRRGLFAGAASLMEIWLEWRMLQQVSHIIAISDQMAGYYAGRTRAHFHRVNNPIAPHFFEPAPAPKPHQILFVGHLNKRKGADVAVEVIARLLPRFPDLILDIIGRTDVDPDFGRRVQARAQKLGGAVRFLGPTDQAGIRAAMERAQLFLLTSRMENAPMVIAEAMATGRPVVATAVGGVETMIEPGVTGYLAPSGDVQTLADGAFKLLSDPAHAAALGANAARFARQNYHPAAVADGYLRAVAAAMLPG